MVFEVQTARPSILSATNILKKVTAFSPQQSSSTIKINPSISHNAFNSDSKL